MVYFQDDNEPKTPAEDGSSDSIDEQTTRMSELVEDSFQSLREGEVVRGMVVALSDDSVVVDIGFKTEGIIPRSEFTARSVQVKVGDDVDVLVDRLDEMLGEVKLSFDRAAKMRVWEVLETAFKDGVPVRGKVLERVKGGLTVDIGIRAFLPGSLVDMRPSRRLEDYIGEEIEARIINFDRRRANVVLSRKALLEQEASVRKDETLTHLEEGMVITGAVKNITDYGVFVDLGGIDGLLHVTDISWGRVGHPSEYFKIGDEVKVVVLRVDRDKERISLGYRQRFEDPWTHVEERYPVGKRISGKVSNVVDYGAFVELEEGVEGLIHVSEMSWTKKVKNPKSLLQSSTEVEVVITEVDVEKRRISLSLRQAEPNPWEEYATRYRVGSKVRGVVRNLTDFGAFVELEPGVDGLVHVSDMAWTRRISHPSEVLQKGQEIEAMIIAMDIPNQRISLSVKELQPNEWDQFATDHQVGEEVEGFVTNVTDFGLFVELAPGVEGLCHISEVERIGTQPLSQSFERGQRVLTRLIRIDWNEKRIGLSLRGITQPEFDEASVSTHDAVTSQPELEADLEPALDESAEAVVQESGSPEPSDISDEAAAEDAGGGEEAQEAERVAEAEPPQEEAQETERVAEDESLQEEAQETERVAEAEPPQEEAQETERVAEAEPPQEEAQETERVAEAEPPQEEAQETHDDGEEQKS